MTETLYSLSHPEHRASIPRGVPLIVAMSGFSDAGSAVSQLEDYFWDHNRPEEVVRFHADEFYDYRARRPGITFVEDHLTDYDTPELGLYLAYDELGAPFLVLMGFEPDFRWEGFVEAIQGFIEEFEVSSTTWVHGIPMPVPHTRDIPVTVSGSRKDLIEAKSVWQPTTHLSATLGHLLEYRLHASGNEVVGFTLLVSHYLAENEIPDALLTVLECLMSSTGLFLATDAVREQARDFQIKIDAQIQETPESLKMVKTLEERHDAYMADRSPQTPLLGEAVAAASADQLVLDLERFLADSAQSEQSEGSEVGDAPTAPGRPQEMRRETDEAAPEEAPNDDPDARGEGTPPRP